MCVCVCVRGREREEGRQRERESEGGKEGKRETDWLGDGRSDEQTDQ